MLLQRLQRNELLRYHYVKTELSAADLMVSVKPFTRREDRKTNSLTDQPGSVIAYGRLSTPAPTMDMTL
ncbi:hypothetical protein HanHA300_Chr05g0166111 [Helianthus annuus]|nr:hypothetical protein HanHA300_Chr05g0166111 [Helianthus annuus]KAJ0583739.1 hypothetical protein HanHA89_Chr05g0180111 [Helianthus annuus]